MQVQNISVPLLLEEKRSDPGISGENFSKLLANKMSASQKSDTQSPLQTKNEHLIALGSVSRDTPNVAHMLLSHPELKSKTWSIVHHPLNQDKPYKQIPMGTEIFYNQQTQELQWSHNKAQQASQTAKITAHNALPTLTPAEPETNKLELGTLNKANPTVSNLLSNNDQFRSSRWNIIHSDLNKDKNFTNIPEGSRVFIDVKTQELSWSSPEAPATLSDTAFIRSKKLDEAVKPFMGTPYKDIDCYTLVVHGLKNMGVKYRGQDSLSKQLLHMAQVEGRAKNAYFTGEGITEAMGEKVYTKAISKVEDITRETQAIYHEMKNLMQKGDILSFSLETKGHTGVISQNQDQWTYINSGHLDNSIVKDAPKHGVGEETLLNEISNWIKLAQQRKESLQITVGRLDNQKLV